MKRGKNDSFKTFITEERLELKFGDHRVKSINKEIVEQIFYILNLGGDIKPQKSSCLPSGRRSINKKIHAYICLLYKHTMYMYIRKFIVSIGPEFKFKRAAKTFVQWIYNNR